MPQYDPSNPHPMYGKDPNIINEWGHTHYPKYVDSKDQKNEKGKPVRVLVQNPKEEMEATGKKVDIKQPNAIPKVADDGWK